MFDEWQRLPAGFLEQLIEYRHYARTKGLYDSATTKAQIEALPRGRLMDLVKEIEFALVNESTDA